MKSYVANFHTDVKKMCYHLRTGKPPPLWWSPGSHQRRRCWLTGSWIAAQLGTCDAPLSENAPGESHRLSWICWSETSRRKTDQMREENSGSLRSKHNRSLDFLFACHVTEDMLMSFLSKESLDMLHFITLNPGRIWLGSMLLFRVVLHSEDLLINNKSKATLFLPPPMPPVAMESALTPFTVARDGKKRHLKIQTKPSSLWNMHVDVARLILVIK